VETKNLEEFPFVVEMKDFEMNLVIERLLDNVLLLMDSLKRLKTIQSLGPGVQGKGPHRLQKFSIEHHRGPSRCFGTL